MLVIRPVTMGDIDDLERLASIAGDGMTSLPQDRDALTRNVTLAVQSFERADADPEDYFLMVLEDTSKGRVVGTSAVYANTGHRQAFYAYRVMSVTHYSHSIEKEVRSSLLHLTNEYTDASEVGTLFLDPEYRGNGHWLSRSRYLLMALFPDRFAHDVIAELRGFVDESGNSPFWDAIGANFFQMSFQEADRLSGIGSNQFITELMPKYPIYSNLLPQAAIDVIGKPHAATERAMQLLLDEGFRFENLVDIFDGGPLVRAAVSQIQSVSSAKSFLVDEKSGDSSLPMLVAKESLSDLRIAYGGVERRGASLGLDEELLSGLEVAVGDKVTALPGRVESRVESRVEK